MKTTTATTQAICSEAEPKVLTIEVVVKDRVLNPCPCCNARPLVTHINGVWDIICRNWGCRHVESDDRDRAIDIWNEPRFSQGKP